LGIPFLQKLHVGGYLIRQQLAGRKRYPLVLMLEPLFRCNLACAGCGKIDYPDEILNQRISVADALQAVDECGAPVVSIAGGEPLLHKELPTIVKGIIARRKFVYLCTNALLMEKRMKDYEPSPYFVWSVHLDGDKQDHDKSVCQAGTYDRAVAAIKAAKAKGFRCNINCTLFNDADPERMANFFDTVMAMGRATPTSARRISSTSSTGARPSNCSATSSSAATAARNGRSASLRCSSTSWPAIRLTTARPGAIRRARCSAGRNPATCSAKATPRPSMN
jgi:hopanoid biosynthesis associated radical SAM protein HpnH